jgi:hypothetical protein
MSQSMESKNKALVLEAFDTLFNKRLPSRRTLLVVQLHSAQRPHRAGPRRSLQPHQGTPASLKYEPGLIAAEGDLVIVHGRFSGIGRPRNWIAADIVRIADGVLAEHWDVLQDEAARAESKRGLPMFGDSFAD